MNAFLVPILESRFHDRGGGDFFGGGHFLHEQTELLPELMKRFEPVIAAMLVSIACEEAVEKFLNILEILLVLCGRGEKRFSGDGGHGYDVVTGDRALDVFRLLYT